MKINIGISDQDRKQLTEGLSHFLADTYTLYLKTQNFHWNVTGPLFESLHLLFEKQYQDLASASDEIAERIRELGFPTLATFADFQRLSSIRETMGVPTAAQMVALLVDGNEKCIHTARGMLDVAERSQEQPTIDLIARRMHIHEKNAWMLRSHLETGESAPRAKPRSTTNAA